ncbi:hypothetical protein [Streptomyces sp. NPDC047928]|uniref:hypothetical protein n=1 Tax=unclassified Streptomyces TaxID=2593676 RepID=UPI00370FFC87
MTDTDPDLRRFNAIAARQRGNPAFAEQFATGLGAQATLAFWRDLADPGAGFDPRGGRARLLAAVQENLSLTLATATHGTSPAVRAWKDDLLAAGCTRVGGDGPYGYQVISSLLTRGRWDTGFLTSYGERLIGFERAGPRHGDPGHGDPLHGGPQALWLCGDPPRLTYPPGCPVSDNDPVNGFLEALGHNPEASLTFFDRFGTWEYLVGDGTGPLDTAARVWPVDRDGRTTGYARLGHALESAALGHPYDAETPGVPAPPSAARTALRHRIAHRYRTTDLIDRQEGIRDSLARVAAAPTAPDATGS